MRIQRTLLTCMLVLVACGGTSMGDDGVLAVKAGRILTVSGEPIDNGVILIKDGKIVEVAVDVNVPEGATVIDASGQVVMPGLVSAGPIPIFRGEGNEQSSEITPAFRISRALDPASKTVKHIRQTGVTAFHVAPGPMNLIGGLGVVVKPRGKTADEMIVKDDASLWITLGSASTYGNRTPRSSIPDSFYFRRPTTRMSVAWMLREAFQDARQYASAKPENPDVGMDVLAAALNGDIPIYMSARRSTDLRMALTLADEYDMKITLFECTEGHKIADALAAKKIPVILEPRLSGLNTYAEGRDVNWNNAGILSDAGVKVALAAPAGPETTDMLTVAILAVRHGMARDLALRAVTLTAAEVLGVADRLGSIDKGKDADLLILSGPPLATTSRIEHVIIDGKTVHRAD